MSEEASNESNQTHANRELDTKSNEGPDGKYTFRRKKGVIYHAVGLIHFNIITIEALLNVDEQY